MPSSKLDRRQSKTSLFDLFSRPRVERSRGYHESGLVPVVEIPQIINNSEACPVEQPSWGESVEQENSRQNRNSLLTRRNPNAALSCSSNGFPPRKRSSIRRPFGDRMFTNASKNSTDNSNVSSSAPTVTPSITPPWSRALNAAASLPFRSFPPPKHNSGVLGPLQPSPPSSSSSSHWEPPTFAQASSMAVKRGNVMTSVISPDLIVRNLKQKFATFTQLTPTSLNDPTLVTVANSGVNRRSNPRRVSSAFGGVANDFTRVENKVFVLINTGYILQYPASSSRDSRPDRVLRLGRESAAFATDLIPGRHWVLHVCEKMSADGKDLTSADDEDGVRRFFKRLGVRATTLHRKTVGNILLVLDTPEDMDDWLRVIRRTIDVLAGRGPDLLNLEPSMTCFPTSEIPPRARPSVSESTVSAASTAITSDTIPSAASTVITTPSTGVSPANTAYLNIARKDRATVQVQVQISPPVGGERSHPSSTCVDSTHPSSATPTQPQAGATSHSIYLTSSQSSPVCTPTTTTMTTATLSPPQSHLHFHTFLNRFDSSERPITSSRDQPPFNFAREDENIGASLHEMESPLDKIASTSKLGASGPSSPSTSPKQLLQEQFQLSTTHLPITTSRISKAAEPLLVATTLAGTSRNRRSLILANPGPSPSYIPESPPARKGPPTVRTVGLQFLRPHIASGSGKRRHSGIPDLSLSQFKYSPSSAPHTIKPSRSSTHLNTAVQVKLSTNLDRSPCSGESASSPQETLSADTPFPVPPSLPAHTSSPDALYPNLQPPFAYPSSPAQPTSILQRPVSIQIKPDSSSLLPSQTSSAFKSCSTHSHAPLLTLSEELVTKGIDSGTVVNDQLSKDCTRLSPPYSSLSETLPQPPSFSSAQPGQVPFLMDSTRSCLVLESGNHRATPRPLRLPVIPTVSAAVAASSICRSSSHSSQVNNATSQAPSPSLSFYLPSLPNPCSSSLPPKRRSINLVELNTTVGYGRSTSFLNPKPRRQNGVAASVPSPSLSSFPSLSLFPSTPSSTNPNPDIPPPIISRNGPGTSSISIFPPRVARVPSIPMPGDPLPVHGSLSAPPTRAAVAGHGINAAGLGLSVS